MGEWGLGLVLERGLGLVLERGLGAVAVARRHALFQRLLQALPRLALVLGPGRKQARFGILYSAK